MKMFVTVFVMLLSAASFAKSSQFDHELLKDALQNFKPLPNSIIDVKANAAKIELGQKLYFEKKLSANNTISCNSCHKLDKFGVDNEATSPGHNQKRGERNSPTVYNAALNASQFWDGRAKDLEEQALGPLLNPIEHGLKDEATTEAILNKEKYLGLFKKAFPKSKKPLSFKNVGVAIAAFEKTLLTPSRFDDFLKGQINALNAQQKQGLRKFIDNGCVACHSGVNIGGKDFMQLGLVEEYSTKDLGRYQITKKEEDKKVFKVPSLRNVAKTGPYLHDGSIKKLEDMIALMGKHQIGITINKKDISDIKAFLESLTAKKLPTFSQK